MNKKRFSLLLLGIVIALVSIVKVTAEVLGNDVHVFENSELIYYINVNYDGKDINGVESSDIEISDIRSGYIYVEDKLPEGLIFEGFVETEDGSIGADASKTDNDGDICLGEVIDGVDGLNYDETTRTVSFTVKGLRAGCMLTVGIKTTTPTLADGIKRMDFYNTASATEGLETVLSNPTHVWIGEEVEEEKLNSVVYEYEGEVPPNAPELPVSGTYVAGATVGVDKEPTVVGYTFSGWRTNDVTVTEGTFIMPDSTVTFKGSFTAIPSYAVNYEISGTVPKNYVIPTSQSYYEGMIVRLDVLNVGDIIEGYRFTGWTVINNGTGEEIKVNEDKEFTMPASGVTITGNFEVVKYKVSYKFQGTMPTNAEELLPAEGEYEPGEVVQLPTPTREGYRFLGWYGYSEGSFEMPEEDITIYGEWAKETEVFEPEITIEIEDDEEYYHEGDTVKYKIVVTNTADYIISDVVVEENMENAKFVDGAKYTLSSSNLVATITSISPNSSVTLYGEYKVDSSDRGTITNEVEIIGALGSETYYVLNTEKEYKASTSFKVSPSLTICNQVNSPIKNTFLYHITGMQYDSWIVLGNGEEKECKTLYVKEGKYKILEVVPQNYKLTSISGIDTNGGELNIQLGSNYKVTFTNEYDGKGFFHTFGRVVNTIKNAITSSSLVTTN